MVVHMGEMDPMPRTAVRNRSRRRRMRTRTRKIGRRTVMGDGVGWTQF